MRPANQPRPSADLSVTDSRRVDFLSIQRQALPTSVAAYYQVERAADAVERAFGPIDIWINNAMVEELSTVKEIRPEEYRRVTEVTYLGQTSRMNDAGSVYRSEMYYSIQGRKRMTPPNVTASCAFAWKLRLIHYVNLPLVGLLSASGSSGN